MAWEWPASPTCPPSGLGSTRCSDFLQRVLRPLAAFTTNSAGNAIVNTDDGPNKMSAEFIANRIQEEAHDQL